MKCTYNMKRRIYGNAEDLPAAIWDDDVCGILFRFQIHI
jgi:hypothetical protein